MAQPEIVECFITNLHYVRSRNLEVDSTPISGDNRLKSITGAKLICEMA